MKNKISLLFLLIILTICINPVNAEDNNTTEIITDENTNLDTINTTSNLLDSEPSTIMHNAIWVRGVDMYDVNFNTLKNSNIDTILLNFAAINKYGKTSVTNWVNTANSNGLNVHIWMQVCYHGSFENPLKNGGINTGLLERDLSDASEFASINGIKGIHLDYLRYPGTAYKNPGGTQAITYFVEQITQTIKNINNDLIVSGSLMPEGSSLTYYYGQNLSALSNILDYIIPMIYKGNYKEDSSWIESTTKYFVTRSQHAKIITGLQTYKSDSNLAKLSTQALQNDVDAAYNGGAYGVALFRYGLTNFIDFKEVDNSTHIKTILSANDFNHFVNEEYDFTGALMDNNGNPIAGHHISLTITRLANGLSKTYDVVSDYNGEYKLPIRLGSGKYSVSASYEGVKFDDIVYDSVGPVIASLIVLRDDLVNVSLITNPYTESFDNSSNFTGFLYDNESNPLMGHSISVTLKRANNNQNKTYFVVTDYTGEFRLSINLAPGEYIAYCSYNGVDKYLSASTSENITVTG